MFEKTGSLGYLDYRIEGPSRLRPGETFEVTGHLDNRSPFDRGFRISAADDAEWIEGAREGFADVPAEGSRTFTAELGRITADAGKGEHTLRIHISTLGATEAFPYPLRIGSPVSGGIWAGLFLGMLLVGCGLWLRKRRRPMSNVS